ncbi:UNKNOWN [Stylonychia lemnae]|uniref:Uncharacterized protein n=1 Tax=Stylonychia lemnae TaxID=5949 RepID=A0A078ANK4_STYLE|nr:UNKNOWN [Stylonychia lemnae]|eukprot:CDW83511.1 UNKNOWN [Stylonychia lemnae]
MGVIILKWKCFQLRLLYRFLMFNLHQELDLHVMKTKTLNCPQALMRGVIPLQVLARLFAILQVHQRKPTNHMIYTKVKLAVLMLLGTYYAGVSLYMQAQCRINFGENPFKYPPQQVQSLQALERWSPYNLVLKNPRGVQIPRPKQ